MDTKLNQQQRKNQSQRKNRTYALIYDGPMDNMPNDLPDIPGIMLGLYPCSAKATEMRLEFIRMISNFLNLDPSETTIYINIHEIDWYIH